jgi:DNA-binding NarL/FixJ family response regulator
MSKAETHCVLLANAHHGLSEGVRGLLSATFKAVVMVADEVSLFESAGRLQSDLAVVDLALARGNALDLIRRLCHDFPKMKVIAIGVHDQSSVGRSVLEAGANGYVVKRAIATDLLLATDAVLDGKQYVSPDVGEGHYRPDLG